jgi:hypothetical protein
MGHRCGHCGRDVADDDDCYEDLCNCCGHALHSDCAILCEGGILYCLTCWKENGEPRPMGDGDTSEAGGPAGED